MSQGELTQKQQDFALYVAQGNTYADAYTKAYNAANMKRETIYVKASLLMDEDKIRIRVGEIQKEATKSSYITIEELLKQMADWMRFDPLQVIDPSDQCTKNLEDMEKSARMSISEIAVQEIWGSEEVEGTKKKRKVQIGQLVRFKFYDKTKVADMFMKKFGQYINTVELNVGNVDKFKQLLDEAKQNE